MRRSRLIFRFGERVRELRLQRGWSQEELGYAADLHRNAISLIERGDRSSTLETIEKLCQALRLQPSALMPEIELPAPKSIKKQR